MTQSEKLQALLIRANKNNFMPSMDSYSFVDGKVEFHKGELTNVMSYTELIFNHEFAKSLFGDRNFDAYKDDQAITEEFECCDAYSCDLHCGERWKIYLRVAVISNDPIDYMYQAVFGDKS